MTAEAGSSGLSGQPSRAVTAALASVAATTTYLRPKRAAHLQARPAALGGLPALGAVLVGGQRAAVDGRAARRAAGHQRQAGRLVALARAAQAPPPPPQQDVRCEQGERQQHRAADRAGDQPRDGRAPRHGLRGRRRPAHARALRCSLFLGRLGVRRRVVGRSTTCSRTRRARLRARRRGPCEHCQMGLCMPQSLHEETVTDCRYNANSVSFPFEGPSS